MLLRFEINDNTLKIAKLTCNRKFPFSKLTLFHISTEENQLGHFEFCSVLIR